MEDEPIGGTDEKPIATEQEKGSKRSSLFSERRGVAWTIVGIVISIVVTFVATYASLRFSEQKRQLAYTSTTPAIKIFDSKSASPALRVLGRDGQPITEDVYVAEVTVWNSGNVNIEPSEVREKLKLRFPSVKALIDSPRITQQTHPESEGFVANGSSVDSGNDDKAVELSWAHFDVGNAVRFQLTFLSNEGMGTSLDTQAEGYIVNTELVPVQRGNSAQSDSTLTVSLRVFSAVLELAVVCVFLVLLWFSRRAKYGLPRVIVFFVWAFIISWVLFLVRDVLALSNLFASPQPPF